MPGHLSAISLSAPPRANFTFCFFSFFLRGDDFAGEKGRDGREAEALDRGR